MNLNWSGKEEYDAILVCPPDGGKGYVHRVAMGASLMANIAEARNYGNDMTKAAAAMDAAGWRFIPIKMQVAGELRSSTTAITTRGPAGTTSTVFVNHARSVPP